MVIGETAVLELGKQINERTYRVVNVNSNEEGILKVKGRLRISQDGCVKAWIIQYDSNKRQYVYGNAYFGKYSISPGIQERYIAIIQRIIANPQAVTSDDISVMKGMANRCLKRDQWDWYTTYEYLGYPASSFLHQFVADCVAVRDEIKDNRRDRLSDYRAKYGFLFNNMLFHLGDNWIVDIDSDIPVRGLDLHLWERLSEESRKNLIILEHAESRSSIFVLMHYFVTLEQEFYRHIISPFIDNNKASLENSTCSIQRYSQTHDILIGKFHYSLGAIPFLGRFVGSQQACSSSLAISSFTIYLGSEIDAFKEICQLIDRTRISSLPLVSIRNGLAHGNSDIINKIDEHAYKELRSFLLEDPASIIKRVINISKL